MNIEPRDLRYIALQLELKRLNYQVSQLLEVFRPDVSSLNVYTKSKASTFSDTDVPCLGYNLIQISTDGDLSDISYKIVQLDGGISFSMEAAESPHIIGPVTAVRVTNDTAEAGKTVRVARYRVSPLTLPAIRHGTPQSVVVQTPRRLFTAGKMDYDGSLNYFETDQGMGDSPTLYITAGQAVKKIQINEVRWQMTPTNAVTYQLYLLRDTDTEETNEGNVFFDSGAACASGTVYIETAGASLKVPILEQLAVAGRIYYMIDWSGPPGDTSGFIKIYGEILE